MSVFARATTLRKSANAREGAEASIHELTDMSSWAALWSGLAVDDAAVAPGSARAAPTGATSLIVFKWSPLCSISRAVEGVFERFAADLSAREADRLYSVNVVDSPDVAQQIARDTGVRHESPQVLVLGPGAEVLWHASHDSIDDQALAVAAEQAGMGTGKAE
ncbi:MAG: monothiol bacilliredoxin BrxC family protein [Planctomycetota bacterium]